MEFQPGQLIGLVAVSGGLVVAAIAIIASHWCRVRLGEIEASLKQQMLEKGMSAAEIEQVIKADKKSISRIVIVATGTAALEKATLTRLMASGPLQPVCWATKQVGRAS